MTDFLRLVNHMGLVVIPSSGGHLLIEGDVDLSGSDIATLPDNLTIDGPLLLDVEKISSPLAWRRVPFSSLTPDDPILQDIFCPQRRARRYLTRW